MFVTDSIAKVYREVLDSPTTTHKHREYHTLTCCNKTCSIGIGSEGKTACSRTVVLVTLMACRVGGSAHVVPVSVAGIPKCSLFMAETCIAWYSTLYQYHNPITLILMKYTISGRFWIGGDACSVKVRTVHSHYTANTHRKLENSTSAHAHKGFIGISIQHSTLTV